MKKINRLHHPKRAVVVCGTNASLAKLAKCKKFRKRFDVKQCLQSNDDIRPILPQLAGYEAVVMIDVAATIQTEIASYCLKNKIEVYIYINAREMLLVRVRRSTPKSGYLFFKRALDIIVSLTLILVTAVPMLFIALAIKRYDGGSAFYKQVRLTKNGKPFDIYNFRSMCTDAEKDGKARLATDQDDRITPIGQRIRACHADELPQLFNILKGDMSLVGPRPERPELVAEIKKTLPAFDLRLQCKAGLTGYAQVYGNYHTEAKDKLKMDLVYMQNMSLWEDAKLCLYTIKVLFGKERAYSISAAVSAVHEISAPRRCPSLQPRI